MGLRRFLSVSAAFGLGLFGAVAAFGQDDVGRVVNRASISRPSEVFRPSQLLERYSNRIQGPQFGGGAPSVIGQLGNSGFLPSGGPMALGRQFQYTPGMARFGSSASMGLLDSRRLPSLPSSDPRVPPPRIQFTKPVGDEFQQFFGLKPVEENQPSLALSLEPELPRTGADLTRRVEQRTERTMEVSYRVACTLFGEGMRRNDPERDAKLTRCLSLLAGVRQLGFHRAEATQLMLHASLEKEEFLRAARLLAELAEIEPDVFSRPSRVVAHYPDYDEKTGTSEIFAAQMRRFVQIGSGTERTFESHALEAYCAWAQNDRVRAAAALARAEQAAVEVRNRGEEVPLEALIYAMKPVLR